MNEQEFIKAAIPAMSDETILPVHIQIKEAWILVSALQLASRHPGITSALAGQITAIARQFQGAIVELHPEAQEPIEMGWHSKYDRKPKKGRR